MVVIKAIIIMRDSENRFSEAVGILENTRLATSLA